MSAHRTNEVYDTLVAAKKLIRRKKNWIKGAFHRDGAYCALGALGMAEQGSPGEYFSDELFAAVLTQVPEGAAGISYFNDHPDTKHRDVIRLFNRAIRAEKKKGLL